ncbi:MAG TPA: hypothetical protein VJ810_23645 [Blastocatellia bacterium]|nr:hypothetical protein [Blastocatellia bacterium]
MRTAEYESDIDRVAEIAAERSAACAGCGETYPDSALDSNGRCERCLIKTSRVRDTYFRPEAVGGVFDGYGVISDADPGL